MKSDIINKAKREGRKNTRWRRSDNLDDLGRIMTYKVMPSLCSAAAKVVTKALRPELPQSKRTGSREKWSEEYESQRSAEKPMRRTLRSKVWRKKRRKGLTGQNVIVNGLGLIEYGRDIVAWGRKTNLRQKPRPIFRPVIDRTLNEQKRQGILAAQKRQRLLEHGPAKNLRILG